MRGRAHEVTENSGDFPGESGDAPLAGKPDIDALGLDPHELDRKLTHHPQITTLTKQVYGSRAPLSHPALRLPAMN